jgi:hypothetical protein
MHPKILSILMSVTLTACTTALADLGPANMPMSEQIAPEDADVWPEAEADAFERVQSVSDGELGFLLEAPAKRVHHHSNQLTIKEQALDDGWVLMHQCHAGIDPVAQAQILFRAERLRALRITGSHNIGRSWVEGASVQMEDIRHDASLCLEAETRALHDLGSGFYELRSGPFMRRFLDGYYPMRISLDIHYPAELELVDYSPEYQAGFRPRAEPQRILVDAWFEGRLHTQFRFVRRD